MELGQAINVAEKCEERLTNTKLFDVTDLAEDESSLNETLLHEAKDGATMEPGISEGRDVVGEFEKVEESHSDYEVVREKMQDDIRKDYCTDSEGPSKIVVQWLAGSNQFVSVKVEENGFAFILTIVYAKCTSLERTKIWEDLVAASNCNLLWILYGDFNIVKDDYEKRGGHPRPFAVIEDFNLCIQNCGLLDMCSKGLRMTWCNGQNGSVRSWARYGSSSFHFQFIWTDHADFLNFVEGVWNQDGICFGLLKLSLKLKRTKVALRDWNQRVFGRTNVIISELENRIDSLENCLQDSFSVEDDNDVLAIKLDLLCWRSKEDTRLFHMTNKSWLQNGDQNSKFFHAYLNVKNYKRVSDMCLIDGTHLKTPFDVHQAVVEYFHHFLSESSSGELPNLGDLIPLMISDDENLMLCSILSLGDIKDAY
ncbi:uncharacterized protein LOC122304933 [Carya illinoinensis]|uniref:uncharacterized protein LOC122304933 n=1 Tax=Carya illinoinensis TaxID=32201 RepID=UPI001C721818|nr:uncharacterized protein LOC122304933 [Carya illinoinensis]